MSNNLMYFFGIYQSEDAFTRMNPASSNIHKKEVCNTSLLAYKIVCTKKHKGLNTD